MREIRDIIWKDYNHLFAHNELLIAHLFKECPAMTHDCAYRQGESRNDYGLAIGMAQWHMWYRYNDWMRDNGFQYTHNSGRVAQIRDQFYKDHPDMKDWRHQTRKYLKEMSDRLVTQGNIDSAIMSWNPNAGYPYLVAVHNQVPIVQSNLNSAEM